MLYEQISFEELLREDAATEKRELPNIRSVGDTVGRVVLGELRTAVVTKVEGLPFYPFYRTDSGGCYSYEEGLDDLEKLRQQAEENRRQYETIEPQNLERRITVKYPPLYPGGGTLWAQVGIFQGMLFWKESMTYQFLQQCKSEKELKKEYEKHKKQILEEFDGSGVIVEEEHPMRRLYRSKAASGYADAEYVKFNY